MTSFALTARSKAMPRERNVTSAEKIVVNQAACSHAASPIVST